jgi:hypothetical protein
VIRLTAVEPSPKSMRKDRVVIVDNGLEVIQWNGEDVKLSDKSKSRILAQQICKVDRMGRATLFEMGG